VVVILVVVVLAVIIDILNNCRFWIGESGNTKRISIYFFKNGHSVGILFANRRICCLQTSFLQNDFFSDKINKHIFPKTVSKRNTTFFCKTDTNNYFYTI
jgi:hypothetical protein